jgi:hypothetical protein
VKRNAPNSNASPDVEPPRPEQAARSGRLPAVLPLLLFTMALLWPLCRGRALYWGDILFYFEPMAAFAKAHLEQGRLPLWNPYVLCGQPFLGNPQMGIFYPTTLLDAICPVWLALSLNTLLHVFLCGAFCFLYLRRWTVHKTSALAGALVYMGSSCLIGRLQFPPMIQTAAYLPLLLYWLDLSIDRPRPEYRLGITLTVALTLLAAHTQMAYMTLLCGIAYATMRLWSKSGRDGERPGLRSLGRQAWGLTCFGGLGLCLTAIQILPALQLMKASTREALTPALANRFVLQPQQLLTLVDPHFFGHPASGDYWGGGNAWEPAIFVGWLPLILIGYAIVRCSRERLVRFWSILALLGFWLALGTPGGLYWLAFYAVPGVSSFHDPARFLFYATFAFAVLSAVGLDALRERTTWCSRRVCRFALVGIAIPLIWYGQEWNPTTTVAAIRDGDHSESVAFAEAKTERLYLPEHGLYWRRIVTDGYSDYGASDPRTIRALRQTLIPNLPMGQGIAMAAGYEPVPISSVAGIDGLARAAFRRGEPTTDNLLSIMQIGIVALPKYQHTFDPGLALSFQKNPSGFPALPGRVAQFQTVGVPPPKAWLVSNVRHIEGKMRVSAVLTSPGFDPRLEAVVTGQGAVGFAAGRNLHRSVRLLDLSETDVRMRVDTGGRPAFLVYSSTAYPGWNGRIDGKAVRPVRTDGAFLGLPIPAGKHVVKFEYRPTAYRLGAYLSLLAAGLCVGMSVPFALNCRANYRSSRPARCSRDVATGKLQPDEQ